MSTRVSCVIRTYNEAQCLGSLIDSLRSQDGHGDSVEIIVVDSGSTDGTVEIARQRDIDPIQISKAEFNYSTALNLGIENSRGELIVMVSAHALPCGTNWMNRMVSHFSDPLVAGVFCRQVPFQDADYSEILRLEHAFGPESCVFSTDRPGPPAFSNAASCIRRARWRDHPFVVLPAAEDHEWAKWAIANGFRIIYDAHALIRHSHKDSARQAAKRLVELEKANDIRLGRNRGGLLTLRGGLRWLVRDMHAIFSSDLCRGRRFACAGHCMSRVFWYMIEFGRTPQSSRREEFDR